MASKTMDIHDLIVPDQLGCEIANKWLLWNSLRTKWIAEKKEIRKYIYATDTTTTTNAQLPWSNKTTRPKLCQIRDNLFSNYMASMFPKRRWMLWEGDTEEDQVKNKQEAIKDYMTWAAQQRQFKTEVEKLVYDYIDYGNAFVTSRWRDDTTVDPDTQGIKPSFVGPVPMRINPLDVVMDPTAPSFAESPKIIRSLMTIGQAKNEIERLTQAVEQKETAESLFNYLTKIRQKAHETTGAEISGVEDYLNVDGFSGFRHYLGEQYIELLTFYGDFYDVERNQLLRNAMIVVADRHKIIVKKQHSTPSGHIPIHHVGWRVRQDNLWAMGPLDNLVGMQYRIDHIENMKADLFDLTTFPPLKIKGLVRDFDWAPFEKIYVEDDGDIEMMAPNAEILKANLEINQLEESMEEMAGAPKEAMGFRTPGEKTKYEVQRLENAGARVFQNKIAHFEAQMIEPLLNDMLGLAKENLSGDVIRVIEDEFKSVAFRDITKSDLSANGRIKPVAARHFAEKAERLQNLNTFFMSPLGQDENVKQHFSGVALSKMLEEDLDIEEFEIVQPYVRLSEQAEAQKMMNTHMEEIAVETATPAGLSPEDTDESLGGVDQALPNTG